MSVPATSGEDAQGHGKVNETAKQRRLTALAKADVQQAVDALCAWLDASR